MYKESDIEMGSMHRCQTNLKYCACMLKCFTSYYFSLKLIIYSYDDLVAGLWVVFFPTLTLLMTYKSYFCTFLLSDVVSRSSDCIQD